MKHVLITGATSGIGQSLALSYASVGHHVYACGRNEEKLTALVRQYENITPLSFDITDKTQVKAACANINEIDIVILNAGDCLYMDDPLHFDSERFEFIINTNLVSMGAMLEQLLPKLAPTNRQITENPQLVFISSSASLLPFPKAQAYGASKAGVDYLANSLALDLAKHRIDVCLVHPGFIKTPLTDRNTFDMPFLMSSEEAADRIIEGITKRKRYLQFPKRLTVFLHLLSSLPARCWQSFASKRLS